MDRFRRVVDFLWDLAVTEMTPNAHDILIEGRTAVRVVGGYLSGRLFKAVPGLDTRPTLDRVREALFNILGDRVTGATVLDLFAGTGALTIEALSRGAQEAVLIEPNPRARSILIGNLADLGLRSRVTIRVWPAERVVKRLKSEQFDLIFGDPPWTMGLTTAVAEALPKLLKPTGWVVWESAADKPLQCPAALRPVSVRRYGRTALHFWRLGEKLEES